MSDQQKAVRSDCCNCYFLTSLILETYDLMCRHYNFFKGVEEALKGLSVSHKGSFHYTIGTGSPRKSLLESTASHYLLLLSLSLQMKSVPTKRP